MNNVLKVFQQFKSVLLGLSTPQKILYSGGILILVGSLAYVFYSTNRTDYAPLYSGLSQTDMAEVVEGLKAQKIPYRLSPNNAVEVPQDKLYETRLALAGQGIPKGSGIGFEIFDQQKLGSTEFVQKINYQRALQGELARTISEMDEVLESRVHLVLPEESLFQEDQKPPSAAVVLKLRPGTRLDPRHIQGIVHLVAGTVRGLQEERVTILSTDGQVLYKKNASDQPLQMTGTQVEHQSRMEEELRQRVQSMLEQVLGANRVLTRVAMDLDFSQVQIAEESYDPDSAVVRSQQRSVENSDGKDPAAKGNPDVPINVESKLLQSAPQPEGAKSKQFNRQRETVNYEINRVSRQIVQAPGTVKKLSVAVIVDGPYEMKAEADGKPKSVFVGRTPDELKSIEEIVKKAVGYNEGRGDQITVSNIPFVTDFAGSEPAQAENRWVQLLKNHQKNLFNVLLIILVFLFVIRPLMRRFQQLGEQVKGLPEPTQAAPALEGDALPELLEQPPAKGLSPKKKALQLVQQNPERATEIIRGWMKEEV